jgi:hypothetical protein
MRVSQFARALPYELSSDAGCDVGHLFAETGAGSGASTSSVVTVTPLEMLSAPYSGSTSGAPNLYTTSCGGSGPEQVFSIHVSPGYGLDIGMTSNNYDSRHELRWGGGFPGTNLVGCIDDPDTTRMTWINTGTTLEIAYFVIDAYSTGSGNFVLTWSLREIWNSQTLFTVTGNSGDFFGQAH